MCTVSLQAALQHGIYTLQIWHSHAREACVGIFKYVEIKLPIEHSGVQIAVNQLRTSVGFADLIQTFPLIIFLDFPGQSAPERQIHVFAGIVAEAVQLKLIQPKHRAVGHHFYHGRIGKINRRHKCVKPRGQAVIVPALGVQCAVRQVERSEILRMIFIQWIQLVNVVSHIIKQNIHIFCMCIGHQFFQFLIGTKPAVDFAE